MPDLDLVVKGLEHCREYGYLGGNDCKSYRKDCPYGRLEAVCVAALLNDVNTILKELGPIAPSVCGSNEPDGHGSWWYLCGKCKKPIDHKDRFCKRCGQAVKWDD